MTEHPITPPPELVQQWADEAWKGWRGNGIYEQDIAHQAARWGADQELEACCEWISEKNYSNYPFSSHELRTARRPKPPSLKEQALDRCNDYIDPDGIIRRALESLPD